MKIDQRNYTIFRHFIIYKTYATKCVNFVQIFTKASLVWNHIFLIIPIEMITSLTLLMAMFQLAPTTC